MNVKCGENLAENPEHVPLLITPATAPKHPTAATTINIPTNVTNGNGLIDNSDQTRSVPTSPVMLSSCTPAHVMRSRLNQYKVGGSYQNNVVVNYDGENVTTVTKASTKSKKKKKGVDI